jgi:hypothetical protein
MAVFRPTRRRLSKPTAALNSRRRSIQTALLPEFLPASLKKTCRAVFFPFTRQSLREPAAWCDPSQKGLFFDSPQWQGATLSPCQAKRPLPAARFTPPDSISGPPWKAVVYT